MILRIGSKKVRHAETSVNDCVSSMFCTRFRLRQAVVGSIFDFKIVSNVKICPNYGAWADLNSFGVTLNLLLKMVEK